MASMASNILPPSFSILIIRMVISISILASAPSIVYSASVVEDLNNLRPPSDFSSIIKTNCLNNPSLRYCSNSSPLDFHEIFKFTIVASHLCNESKNPNCVETFGKIDLASCPKIAPLYLSFDFFWKYCPLTILSINLSSNSLNGNFPFDILRCSQIQALDLSHNNLHGDIPIQSFSLLTNITLLNLSYNHFLECKISDAQFFKLFNSSSFFHFGLLPNHRGYKINALILFVGFPLFVILAVCFLGWLCFYRPDFLPGMLRRKHKFTIPMLKAATDGFSKKNLVGKSEGVDIYKGTLRDGTDVRIEIYRDKISRESCQKFVEECKVLVQLVHKNLVRVMGWCNNRRRLRAIVTEWNNGENVEMWLSTGSSSPSRPWKQRLRILLGILEGMSYLQEQWPEIWYDLRTSSILLSDNGEPLISRFKVEERNSRTRKIYKFGLLVLEMVANKRPQEEFENGDADFIKWMSLHYPGNVQKVIDESIQKKANTINQCTQAIGLGLICTDLSTGQQPSLVQIYKLMTELYDSNHVSASVNQKKMHGDKAEGHRHFQSQYLH